MSAIYGLPKRFITNYSMKADSVLWLIGELECRRPRFILEVGCGISTVAIAAYLSHNYSDTLRPLFVSLESDPEWLDKTRGAIDSLELTKAVMMKHAPLVRAESFGLHGTGIDIGELPLNNRIDFLVVDAPPSVIGRVMVVPQIHEYLADGAEIVLDDAARPGEVEAVETWRRLGLVDFKGYVVSGNGIASMRKRK
jgi:predicted O-methyltransferase YrrM